MSVFTDNQNRTWNLGLNAWVLKAVKELTGENLGDLFGSALLQRLGEDPVLLVDVLYAICKPQCEAQKVSDEDFGRALAGDAIDGAVTALLEALIEFSPKAKREALQKVFDKVREAEATVLQDAMQKIDKLDIGDLVKELGKRQEPAIPDEA